MNIILSIYFIIFQMILNVINSTRLVYEKNIWIRGPHHSKVNIKSKY